MWITNGIQGDWICLLVNTSDGPVHKSKSLICVPLDAPGVTRFKKIDKIGMHSSDTAQLVFENVRVPAANIIGEEGSGFIYQMIQFQPGFGKIFFIVFFVKKVKKNFSSLEKIYFFFLFQEK